MDHNHEFNWDDVKILDEERYLGKRLISEVLFINKQNNGLNLKSDTDSLHQSYFDILQKL
jgi:hypothetical protein